VAEFDESTPAELSASEAIAAVDAGGWLLDVREVNEWESGHAPLAHSLPMSEFATRVDEIPTDRTIITICHSGARSARVVGALIGAGVDAVNVSGGMLAWQSAGGVVVVDGSPTSHA